MQLFEFVPLREKLAIMHDISHFWGPVQDLLLGIFTVKSGNQKRIINQIHTVCDARKGQPQESVLKRSSQCPLVSLLQLGWIAKRYPGLQEEADKRNCWTTERDFGRVFFFFENHNFVLDF